jgi:hypothetical protein
MILDIVFERLVSEVNPDCFASMTKANRRIDRHSGAYIFENATYSRSGVLVCWSKEEAGVRTEECTVLSVERSILTKINPTSNNIAGYR